MVGHRGDRTVCPPNHITLAIAKYQLRVINAEYKDNRLPLASEPPQLLIPNFESRIIYFCQMT
jgi:hypothetical protein